MEVYMIIGVDPGMNGGIAWGFENKIYAEKMPTTPKDIYNFLYDLAFDADGHEDIVCYIERVGGYRPGNSGPASVKFARHCGHLEMALLALNVKYIEILPSKWMAYLIGKQKYPKSMTAAQRKRKRKNMIKAKVQGLYPDLRVTLATSDALGILNYGDAEYAKRRQ